MYTYTIYVYVRTYPNMVISAMGKYSGGQIIQVHVNSNIPSCLVVYYQYIISSFLIDDRKPSIARSTVVFIDQKRWSRGKKEEREPRYDDESYCIFVVVFIDAQTAWIHPVLDRVRNIWLVPSPITDSERNINFVVATTISNRRRRHCYCRFRINQPLVDPPTVDSEYSIFSFVYESWFLAKREFFPFHCDEVSF